MLYDEWKCQDSCYTKKAKLEAQSLSFSTPNSEKETNRCPVALPSAVRMVLIALLVFWCFSISAGCYFSLFWHKLGYGLTLTLVPVRASHFRVSLRSPSCPKTCCAFKQVGGIPSALLQPACQGQGRAVCCSPCLPPHRFPPHWDVGSCSIWARSGLLLLTTVVFLGSPAIRRLPCGRGCPRGCFWPLGRALLSWEDRGPQGGSTEQPMAALAALGSGRARGCPAWRCVFHIFVISR